MVSNKGNRFLVKTLFFDLLSFSYDERYQEKLISGRTEIYLLKNDSPNNVEMVDCGGKKYLAYWVIKPANHFLGLEKAKNDLFSPCDRYFAFSTDRTS